MWNAMCAINVIVAVLANIAMAAFFYDVVYVKCERAAKIARWCMCVCAVCEVTFAARNTVTELYCSG